MFYLEDLRQGGVSTSSQTLSVSPSHPLWHPITLCNLVNQLPLDKT